MGTLTSAEAGSILHDGLTLLCRNGLLLLHDGEHSQTGEGIALTSILLGSVLLAVSTVVLYWALYGRQ